MGVFKRMLTERDDKEVFLIENQRLQDRIADLKSRLEEVFCMDPQRRMHLEWEVPIDIQGWEIDSILPESFVKAVDIRNAISAAQEKLLALWMEFYGADDEECEGQLCIFDFISPLDGALRAA